MPFLSERRPPGARRFAPPAWLCALSLALLATVALVVAPTPRAAASTTATTAATATPTVPTQVVTTLFKARTEYYCTRIPAVVTTGTGVVLAFAEGRKRLDSTGCSDIGDNDLVLKRSLDGGRTWEKDARIVVGAGDVLAHGNPAPVVDAATGRITLLYSSSDWNRDPAAPSRSGHARTVHAVHSTDGGATWSSSVALPHLKPAEWIWVSTGPGHGIQLDRGPHQGRLIVPGDHTARGSTTGAHLYYSDDGGLTWSLGAVTEPVSDKGAFPGELTVVQTTTGAVYVNARNSAPTRCTTNEHRLETTSTDGGASFAAPFTPVANLDTSPTYGSLLRLHAKDRGGVRDRLLYSGPSRLGPSPLEDRRELAVRSSYDEGRSWQTVGTLVSAARTGYSDLTLLPDRSIGVLYETAGNIPHGNVVFASFTEANMDAAATELRLPRTADTRERPAGQPGNHALVHGGAVLGARGGGKAMAFDGTDDYLRLVCSPSLRVEDKDFTITAWFRHSATTGTLPIIWAYGMQGRHFSVRAEPGAGVLRATIGTDARVTEVTLPSSYNDGAWHHVVFSRGAGISLAVDGGAPATAPIKVAYREESTSLTPAGEFSIHIGARPDFPNQPPGVAQLFRGALDDVRLFGRTLTPQEAALVKDGSLAVATDEERLRLGFSTLW
ncbi:exo-alpha-sialidase [Streptomyces sp. NPDC001809]